MSLTRPSARNFITAAVMAGVPAGLLYALATLFLSGPVLFTAEAVELGHTIHPTLSRTLWTVLGSLVVGCALALILAPIVRAVGVPSLRHGVTVVGLAFGAMIVLPGLWLPASPPGVSHLNPVATRQAVWMLSGIGFLLMVAVSVSLIRPLWQQRWVRWAAIGTGIATSTVLLGVLWNGGMVPAGHSESLLPQALENRFRHISMVCNLLLFAALALFIPPALRRVEPA